MSQSFLTEEEEHTAECYAMPDCLTCGRQKKPYGRNTMTTGYCDSDCPGYQDEPRAGHLWPDEACDIPVEPERQKEQ